MMSSIVNSLKLWEISQQLRSVLQSHLIFLIRYLTEIFRRTKLKLKTYRYFSHQWEFCGHQTGNLCPNEAIWTTISSAHYLTRPLMHFSRLFCSPPTLTQLLNWGKSSKLIYLVAVGFYVDSGTHETCTEKFIEDVFMPAKKSHTRTRHTHHHYWDAFQTNARHKSTDLTLKENK